MRRVRPLGEQAAPLAACLAGVCGVQEDVLRKIIHGERPRSQI